MRLPYPYPSERFSLVGRVGRPHGLKGEIKVTPLARPAEAFCEIGRVALVAADGRMTDLLAVTGCRPQGRQVIIKLDTIDTKEEAGLLAAMGVIAPRDAVTGEDTGDADLIGRTVTTVAGDPVGMVVELADNGAQQLLVIRDGPEEYLVPFIAEMIDAVDEQGIVIDPPPGLLDLNREKP